MSIAAWASQFWACRICNSSKTAAFDPFSGFQTTHRFTHIQLSIISIAILHRFSHCEGGMHTDKTMWAATATVFNPQTQPMFAKSFTNRTNRKTFNITTTTTTTTTTASISNFPLASRIMVKNLPYSTSESCLQKEFSSFGQIAEVKLVKDASTKRSKGYAFIQYTSQNDAILALENMDHQVFDGRLIYVEIAKPGKDILGKYPRTSGPPKEPKTPHIQEQDEVVDCWY